MQALALVRLIFGTGGVFPTPLRLIWLHARSANFLDEETGSGQRAVAEHLGGETILWAAREQFVVRIACEQLRARLRGLAIGGRGDDEFAKRLQVPAGIHEMLRLPV